MMKHSIFLKVNEDFIFRPFIILFVNCNKKVGKQFRKNEANFSKSEAGNKYQKQFILITLSF